MSLYKSDKSKSDDSKFDLERLMSQYHKSVSFEGDSDECVSIIESSSFLKTPSQCSDDSFTRTNKKIYRSRSTRRMTRGDFTNFSNLNKEIIIEESEHLYEPTYKLKPNKGIDLEKIESVMKESLNTYIKDIDVPILVKSQIKVENCLTDLTSFIKSRLRSLKKYEPMKPMEENSMNLFSKIIDDRYRIIIFCYLVEKKYQGCIAASRCLWNSETDASITVKEERGNHEFIINFFAVYYE